MIVSPMNQVFYPQEADRLFDHCTCGNWDGDLGIDCDWCQVYYFGESGEWAGENETETAWIEYAKSIRAGAV